MNLQGSTSLLLSMFDCVCAYLHLLMTLLVRVSGSSIHASYLRSYKDIGSKAILN